MFTIKNYVRAQSLEEAWTLNQKRSSRVLGGMLWLKMGRGTVQTAIDLCDLGLDTIEETESGFSIGATVTLRQLEQHPGLNAYTQNAVQKAVQDIVGVQFRNLATVGGSLWGRFGFSDVLTVFLAMDCQVELYKGGTVPLEEFLNRKHDRDILVRVLVNKVPARFAYTAMRIQRTDFPVLTCAVSDVGGVQRAVIGARPNKAMVIRNERSLGAAEFADYVSQVVPTGSNLRGSAAYRTHLARVLTQRALAELGGGI